ncbi:MAG: bifunctional ADP-dependent NAD(P)H-hydrate dehydratase/NAD(P)H-hydrate epimerase, partial [Actinomycetota bacterium]|nr:bifunctional ADP-dependent NAD(P)H-hydrate dehydratase/NAD(P)H-hydrate epimerase [Actinomycetota bacterium]
PGTDRVAAVRHAARISGAVVLLKGSTTVVAHPDGRVLLSDAGSSRLATAGTGDVLSGVIAALVARGVEPFQAAALGAQVHGRASALGPPQGLVASDLPALISRWLSGARRPWA